MRMSTRVPLVRTAVLGAVVLLAAGCAGVAPTDAGTDPLADLRTVHGVLDVVRDGDLLVVTVDPTVGSFWDTIVAGDGSERPGLAKLAVPTGLVLWLHAADDLAEVDVRVDATSGADSPARRAQLLFDTPGVVRAVVDGDDVRVEVADAEALGPVARMLAARGIPADRVSVRDGSASVEVADHAVPVPSADPGPWPDDAAAPACQPADLDVSILGGDAATGHRALVLGATNVSDAACAVQGYPDLTWRTRARTSLDVRTVPGTSFMAVDPGPVRVVVPAGGQVRAVAGWNASSTAGHHDDLAAQVDVAVLSGADAVAAPLSGAGDGSGEGTGQDTPGTTVDILDGSQVEITAWAPASTAW